MTRTYNYVKSRENVTAGVTNRAPRELQSYLESLAAELSAANLGHAIYSADAAVETGAKVGMPVYWNTTTNRYERAILAVEPRAASLTLLTLPSSRPQGIIKSKSEAGVCKVLLAGQDTIDLTEALQETPLTAGLYYLSMTTAGKLTKTRPPIACPILEVLNTTSGLVFVRPQYFDAVDQRQPYRYEMVCLPAGEHVPPAGDDPHEITAADSTVEGWLPADDAIFDGKAPEGAVFGYNFSTELRDAWPPLPLESAYLDFDRGEDPTLGFQGVSLGAPYAAIIDQNGIWWMSNCHGDVPWPTAYNSATMEESDFIDSDPATECPRQTTMRMILWYSRPTFLSETSVVTSLVAAENSPISITCATDGLAASRGPLEIDLDLDFTSAGDDTAGFLAFKSLTGSTFNRGPVLEGLIAGSGVTLESATTKTVGEDTVYQGIATLALNESSSFRDLDIEVLKHEGTIELSPGGVMAVALRAGKTSDVVGKFTVPISGIPSGLSMYFRFWIMGRVAGTLPAVTLSYRRIPRPSPASTPEALPLSDTSLDWATSYEVAVEPNEYVEAQSDPFTVAAGDVVLFTFGRSDGDAYEGDIALLTIQAAWSTP